MQLRFWPPVSASFVGAEQQRVARAAVGEHPVGTVYLAVDGPAGTRVVRRALRGDRARIRRLSVVHALDLLRRELAGLPPRAG